MTIRIVHSRISENGSIDGAPGDQTGREVEISKLTDRDWHSIFRCNDLDKRDIIASTAEDGAKNCHIGYGQKTRLTLYDAAKKAGFNLAKVSKDCNCDCSSFVAVCVIAAGVQISPDMYTGNMDRTLTGSGKFIRLPFDSKSLRRGDIILCSGHTAIVTEGAYMSADETEIETPVYAAAFDKSRAGTYEAETALYLREGNGISYPAYTVIPSGARVLCYGYYSAGIDSQRKGTYWLLVEFDTISCRYTGFVCEKWLKKVEQ